MKKQKRKFWIKFTTYYCPVCGKEEKYRERIYDSLKPNQWKKRNIFVEQYDYCNSLP